MKTKMNTPNIKRSDVQDFETAMKIINFMARVEVVAMTGISIIAIITTAAIAFS